VIKRTRPDMINGTLPDHVYLYTGGIESFHYAATTAIARLQKTVGDAINNTDTPVLISYLNGSVSKKAATKYLSFHQSGAVRQIGIRTMVIETESSEIF